MRALNGAIITAAALIGLGLTAQGIGTRYQNYEVRKPTSDQETSGLRGERDPERSHIKIHEMDNGLKLCLTLLVLALLVGLGITFVGLMYHHHRRYHEHLRAHPSMPSSTHITS